MSMKMKGLLKGLRYISTIFDEEEEAEMQIGFPTDVKHVAHIGWDGPTANSPSWINQFKDGESGGGTPPTSKEDQQNARRTKDTRFQGEEKRISTGSDTGIADSPSRRKSDRPKGSRRASSASTSVTDSPRRSTGSDTKPKQLPTAEGDTPPAGQKTSRRKKTKGSSTGGTSSSSRTSNKSKSTVPPPNASPFSDPGTGQRRVKGKDTYQGSILKNSPEQDDQKALDDISRGIHAM